MKTLVLYSSKYGCTEDCAKYLKGKLNHETKIVNLKNVQGIDLQQYDFIIIGGSIYAGNIRKEVKLFCEQSLQALLTKKLALFICCTTPQQSDNFFKGNFPEKLLNHSTQNINFGGDIRPDKMGFFAKLIVAIVSKSQPKKAEILYSNIDYLAKSVNAEDK